MFLCHGLVMVRDVLLSWFHHGLSWFVIVHVMVRDVSLSWFRHGSLCFTVMVSSWFMSWFVMFLCHGFVMVRDVLLSWFRHGS